MTTTLEELEDIIGYTVDDAVAEYKAGDYGDPEDWDAEKACDAEINGDAGQQIRRRFKDEDERLEAYALWERGIRDAWEEI
jgi:hypothetical protein